MTAETTIYEGDLEITARGWYEWERGDESTGIPDGYELDEWEIIDINQDGQPLDYTHFKEYEHVFSFEIIEALSSISDYDLK